MHSDPSKKTAKPFHVARVYSFIFTVQMLLFVKAIESRAPLSSEERNAIMQGSV